MSRDFPEPTIKCRRAVIGAGAGGVEGRGGVEAGLGEGGAKENDCKRGE